LREFIDLGFSPQAAKPCYPPVRAGGHCSVHPGHIPHGPDLYDPENPTVPAHPILGEKSVFTRIQTGQKPSRQNDPQGKDQTKSSPQKIKAALGKSLTKAKSMSAFNHFVPDQA
jgi:hypothetical protein